MCFYWKTDKTINSNNQVKTILHINKSNIKSKMSPTSCVCTSVESEFPLVRVARLTSSCYYGVSHHWELCGKLFAVWESSRERHFMTLLWFYFRSATVDFVNRCCILLVCGIGIYTVSGPEKYKRTPGLRHLVLPGGLIKLSEGPGRQSEESTSQQ